MLYLICRGAGEQPQNGSILPAVAQYSATANRVGYNEGNKPKGKNIKGRIEQWNNLMWVISSSKTALFTR